MNNCKERCDYVDCINQKVKHKKWGIGTIVKHSGNIIDISFECGEKRMQYPGAFEQFLIAVDNEFQNYVLELIKAESEKEEAKKQARLKEQERVIKAYDEKQNKLSARKYRKVSRENIAFKCNFCDGGCSENHIGFRGPCSDELIDMVL